MPTTKIFYVKILGDQTLGARLLEKLGEKECHNIGNDCHAFKKFENNTQLTGGSSKPDVSFLYQVNITNRDGVGRYNLQIFKPEGKSLRRVRNGGNFTPQKFEIYANRKITQEEFFDHLVDGTIGISFK